jgi:hypothetical protein
MYYARICFKVYVKNCGYNELILPTDPAHEENVARVEAGLLSHCWHMTEVEHANNLAGYYFFSDDTMRFFKTRLGSIYNGPGGVFFTATDQLPDGSRRASVWNFNPLSGKVSRIEDTPNTRTARKLALKLAKGAANADGKTKMV